MTNAWLQQWRLWFAKTSLYDRIEHFAFQNNMKQDVPRLLPSAVFHCWNPIRCYICSYLLALTHIFTLPYRIIKVPRYIGAHVYT